MTFTLSINGGSPVAAQSTGARIVSRRQLNQKPGSLRLEFARALGQSAPPIAFGDIVRVWLDGVPLFAGTAGSPMWRDDGGSGSFSVEIRDVLQGLEDMNFVRGYGPLDGTPTGDIDPGYTTPGGALLTEELMPYALSGHTMLGMTGYYAAPFPDLLTHGQQALEAVRFAKSRLTKAGALSYAFDSAAEAALLADMPRVCELPQPVNGLSCLQLLTKLWRWYPDAAMRADYSALTGTAGLPALSMVRMAEETPRAVRLGADGWRARDMAVRHDMRPAGVVLRFELGVSTGQHRVMDYPLPLGTQPSQAFPLTAQANQPRVLAFAVPAPTDWVVLPALAEEMYERLSALVVEGTLTRTAAALDLTLRPGTVLTLDGDAPSWPAGGVMYVQEVTDDFASGTQTVRCGYPGHLGVTDLTTLGQSMILSLVLNRAGWQPSLGAGGA